jgi:predicted nucleic acid-binding protein
MKRFLFDSGIANDYINPRNNVRERAHAEVAKGSRIGTCVPVLAELLFGIELSTSRDKNMDRLHRALCSLTL